MKRLALLLCALSLAACGDQPERLVAGPGLDELRRRGVVERRVNDDIARQWETEREGLSNIQGGLDRLTTTTRASRSRKAEHRARRGGCRSLEDVKRGESRGNYRAVNPNGHYGAYQFDQETFDGAARRSGHPEYAGQRPDSAPPSVQDDAARQLHRERGFQPWSVC